MKSFVPQIAFVSTEALGMKSHLRNQIGFKELVDGKLVKIFFQQYFLPTNGEFFNDSVGEFKVRKFRLDFYRNLPVTFRTPNGSTDTTDEKLAKSGWLSTHSPPFSASLKSIPNRMPWGKLSARLEGY